MFGRSPILPITIPAEEIIQQQWTKRECYDHLAAVQQALADAYEIAKARMDNKRRHMKAMFDRLRSSLQVTEGDYVYIAEPFSKKLRKLEPRAKGPYPITHVSHHPDTGDIVAVEVEVTSGETGELIKKYFPRRRLRPIRFRLPRMDWRDLSLGEEQELVELQKEIDDCSTLVQLGAVLPQTDKAVFLIFDADGHEVGEETLTDLVEMDSLV